MMGCVTGIGYFPLCAGGWLQSNGLEVPVGRRNFVGAANSGSLPWSFLFFRAQQELHSEIRNPTGLRVLARDCLDGAPSHEEQPEMAFAIERLATAHIEGQFTLLRS